MSISAGASAPSSTPSTIQPSQVRKASAKRQVTARAYLRELWTRKDLIRVLASRELKSQYEMNVIGFAWWLAEPLTLTLIYVIVIDFILGSSEPAFPLFVLCALLPFKWFASGLTGSMGTVRLNGQLVTDVYFPRALLPLVENVVGLAHFGIGLAIIPIFMGVYGIAPTIHLLWLPLVMLAQFVLILAFAYPLSVWGLYYRNVQNLSGNILRLWFYLSPGIWSLDRIDKPWIVNIVKLNPLTGLFTSYRGAILKGHAPGWDLAYSFGLGVVVLVWGFRYFIRREAQFGKLV
jgi:ABC-type polysaccharide/polyol phosphate export permease